jgi:hypothetical protein
MNARTKQQMGTSSPSSTRNGLGYQIVSVFLRDGKRFDRVTVVGGTITEGPEGEGRRSVREIH